MTYDFAVIGAGPTGATFARLAAEAGKKVWICDSRNHVGGNTYDEVDEDTGVLKHVYGPHIFRTDSERVFGFLKRFAEWDAKHYRLLSQTRTRRFQWPINLTTLEQFFECGTLTELEAEALLAKEPGVGEYPDAKNSAELIINRFGMRLYMQFFADYTFKQWGISAENLAPEVCARVVNPQLDRYAEAVRGRYRCMPRGGFTDLFHRMLAHKNIDGDFGVDYPSDSPPAHHRMVYTGPVDSYFKNCFGKLPWRGLKIQWSHEELPTLGLVFPQGADPLTRAIDIRHITDQMHLRPCTSYEYPSANAGKFYPVPTAEARALAQLYSQQAAEEEQRGVYFAGRLATYKYINIDQAIEQAMQLADRVLL